MKEYQKLTENNNFRFEQVKKQYDNDEPVLKKYNFEMNKEIYYIISPSGCRKDNHFTALIAGFTNEWRNHHFNGKVVNDYQPMKRKVNTVFKIIALFPHMNVYENMLFGITY